MDTDKMRAELLSTLDEIEQRKVALLAELQATREAVVKENINLESARSQTTKTITDKASELERLHDARARDLKSLEDKIKSRQKDCSEIEAAYQAKKTLHDQIEASLDSLRKRFA